MIFGDFNCDAVERLLFPNAAAAELDRDAEQPIRYERVGRKSDGVCIFLTRTRHAALHLQWLEDGDEPIPLDAALALLTDPNDAQKILPRLAKAYAQAARVFERSRFTFEAERYRLYVETIEEARQIVIAHIAHELRRRDAAAAMDADPNLIVAEAAERYGLVD